MLQVNPRNILPISIVKAKLNSLADNLNGEPLIVSKNGRPKLGIVSLDYLEDLQKKADFAQMQQIENRWQENFRQALVKKGYNLDKLTDEDVYNLLDKNEI